MKIDVANKDDQLMKIENKVNELSEVNKILENKNNELITQLSKIKADNDENKNIITYLKNQQDELISKYSILASEKDKNDRMLEYEKTNNNNNMSQIEDLTSRLYECQDQLSKQEVLIVKYEKDEEINRDRENNRDLNNENIKNKNIELLSHIKVLNDNNDDLKDEIRQLKQEIQSQKELIVELHIENEELKKEEEMYKKMKDLKLESLNCLMKSNIEAAATIDGFIRTVKPEDKRHQQDDGINTSNDSNEHNSNDEE